MPRTPSSVPLHRANILFPKPTWLWIVEEAKKLGITATEFLRRLVDEKRLAPTASTRRGR